MVPSHNQILGVGGADLSIVPDVYASNEHPADTLYQERHVVVGCASNPLLAKPLSEEEFLAAGHVVPIFGGGDNKSYADEQLEVMGKGRKIEVMTSSFTAVPWLLMGTRLLSLMSERLARMMAQQLPLAIAPCPIEIPMMAQVAQYHRARRDDAGLIWLRQQLREEVQASEPPAM
jgi:DNA-binding transcriptional LysR family regulator